MGSLLTLRTWLILSAIWMSVTGLLCWEAWPRLPLDVSATDPGTQVAHNLAIEFHVFQYSTLGLLPPVFAFAAGWVLLKVFNRQT